MLQECRFYLWGRWLNVLQRSSHLGHLPAFIGTSHAGLCAVLTVLHLMFGTTEAELYLDGPIGGLNWAADACVAWFRTPEGAARLAQRMLDVACWRRELAAARKRAEALKDITIKFPGDKYATLEQLTAVRSPERKVLTVAQFLAQPDGGGRSFPASKRSQATAEKRSLISWSNRSLTSSSSFDRAARTRQPRRRGAAKSSSTPRPRHT